MSLFKTYIVAGGGTGGGSTETFVNSVLALLPSASQWTALASLPRPLYRPKASIVSNRLWLACGERLTAKHRDRPFSDQVRFPLNQLPHFFTLLLCKRFLGAGVPASTRSMEGGWYNGAGQIWFLPNSCRTEYPFLLERWHKSPPPPKKKK